MIYNGFPHHQPSVRESTDDRRIDSANICCCREAIEQTFNLPVVLYEAKVTSLQWIKISCTSLYVQVPNKRI